MDQNARFVALITLMKHIQVKIHQSLFTICDILMTVATHYEAHPKIWRLFVDSDKINNHFTPMHACRIVSFTSADICSSQSWSVY